MQLKMTWPWATFWASIATIVVAGAATVHIEAVTNWRWGTIADWFVAATTLGAIAVALSNARSQRDQANKQFADEREHLAQIRADDRHERRTAAALADINALMKAGAAFGGGLKTVRRLENTARTRPTYRRDMAHVIGNGDVTGYTTSVLDQSCVFQFSDQLASVVVLDARQFWASTLERVRLAGKEDFSDKNWTDSMDVEAGIPVLRAIFRRATSISKAYGLLTDNGEDIDRLMEDVIKSLID